MGTENTNLATELLREIKASARRWFIAFLVMCGLEICTVAGFLYYISLPVEEYYTIEQDSDNYSTNSVIGGDYNGSETAGNIIQEEK